MKNSSVKVFGDEIKFSALELCEYLGVTRRTVYSYKKKNLIPYRKIGGRYYFLKEEIDRIFIKQNKVRNGAHGRKGAGEYKSSDHEKNKAAFNQVSKTRKELCESFRANAMVSARSSAG